MISEKINGSAKKRDRKQSTRNTLITGSTFDNRTFDSRDQKQSLMSKKKVAGRIKSKLANLDFTDCTSPWNRH